MRGHLRRTGKDRRPIGPDGKRVGRDVRSYTAVIDVGTENGRRKQQWKSFATEKAAETWITSQIGDVNDGRYVAPSKATIKEHLTDWLAAVTPSLKPTTAEGYEKIVNYYLIPTIGSIRVRDLTPERIGRLYSELADPNRKRKPADKKPTPLSSRTIRYSATLLKAALEAAVRDGKLGRNPAKYVRPPMWVAKRRKQTWAAEQLRQFLAGAESDYLYAAYRLAATTGLRRGEIAALRWSDLDFENGRLTVQRNRVLVRGEVIEQTPKRGRGRTLGLDAETVAIMQAHRTRQLAHAYDLGSEAAPEDVFLDDFGRPINPESLAYRFELAVKASGLPYLSMHGLRHTWASLALQAGVHPKVVQERLGHSSIAVTMNVYSHVLAEMDVSAAETVAGLFSAPAETSQPHV